MMPHHTAAEIVAHLETMGVYANVDLVGRLRRDNKVSSGYHEYVVPANTFEERVRQYIDAVYSHDGEIWSNRYIALHGATWARCATKLCKAGLIKRVDAREPARYTQIADNERVEEWFNGTKEIK